MAGNTDDTVILSRPRRRGVLTALLLGLLAALAGVVALWPAPRRPPAGETILIATESQIADEVPGALTISRFAPAPSVLVLDFPTLAQQGRMLNRLAALAEKAGQPHDRLLDDAALLAAIRASGTTPDTYYYGHDYPSGDVTRFFALAARDKVALNPDEERLRLLSLQAGAEPQGFGALISLPRADAANDVDRLARVAILHHELSHGRYFIDPAYRAVVGTIWRVVLTDGERAAFRKFLGGEGYDTGLEDLMANEMQAYLMFTPDPRFFDPARLGIPPARIDAIRAAFTAAMPPPG